MGEISEPDPDPSDAGRVSRPRQVCGACRRAWMPRAWGKGSLRRLDACARAREEGGARGRLATARCEESMTAWACRLDVAWHTARTSIHGWRLEERWSVGGGGLRRDTTSWRAGYDVGLRARGATTWQAGVCGVDVQGVHAELPQARQGGTGSQGDARWGGGGLAAEQGDVRSLGWM